jgi:glycosyltransferase involved in cell wall biosynthesis
MRIGLITGEYPPMQGGVGDFTCELARALNELGHQAHVITGWPHSAALRPFRSAPRIGEGRFAEAGSRGDDANIHRAIESWGVRCWGQIADVVHQYDLEVLNIQYEPAAYSMHVGINFLPGRLIRSTIKRPIVTTFHDLLVPYLFPKAGSLRWKVVEYLARHSDAVITTNEEDRARLSNLQRPIANLQLVPIGSNIDPALVDVFDREQARSRWNIRSDEYLIGYFGFLNLSKGGEVLMRALKTLIDDGLPLKLLLIGGRTGSSDPTNAEYAAQVERLVTALNLKGAVITTGYVDSIAVSCALFACDVMALPYTDGASLRRGSLLAAIAHGRAIVTTTPLYPIDGLTQDRSAVFVPPNDPLALANAIRQVLNDAALRRRLEHGAREAAKLFTWDQIAMRTVEVYRSVVRDE